MAQQGATLQTYNNELVKCIEDLKEKREEIHQEVLKHKIEKENLEKDINVLIERLKKVDSNLEKNIQTRIEYDRTIQNTEAAYIKILESCQTLLHVLKRETLDLAKKEKQF